MLAYSDEQLVSEALDDSHQAFGQLVKQYQHRVLRTITSIISDEQAAQDGAQEAFLSAWSDLPKLKEKHKFGGWLNQIAINLSKHWLRDQRKHREGAVPLEENTIVLTQELRYHREKLRQEVWEAIDALAADNRETVILYYISGYSYKEISEMSSVPISTVRGRLQRARNQLRKEFLDMVKKLQLEMDSTLHNFLREHAERDGTSIEGLIVRLIERYKREIDTGVSGAPGAGPTYRLIFDNEIADMPVKCYDFSPGGDQIVFASEGKLYITDGTGTTVRPILHDLGQWRTPDMLQWSPDGEMIAYITRREVTLDSGTREGRYAIFVLSPEGGEPRQIGPELLGCWEICWTPDSQHLTYRGHRFSTLALDGSEVRSIPGKDLLNVHAMGTLDGYSPDERWLTFSERKKNICLIPAAGGTARRLTNLPGSNSNSTWAPDGSTLYFVSRTAYNWNIWKLPMDSETGLQKGEPQQVTFFNDAEIMHPKVLGDGGQIAFGMQRISGFIQVADTSTPHEALPLIRSNHCQPELSPDGQTIYYVGGQPGEEGIFAVPREGGTPRRLTQSRPEHRTFHLSPDGQALAYVAELDAGRGIYIFPTSAGEPQLLVKTTEAMPQWSPDGSQLAYSDGEGLYTIPAAGGQPRELAHLDDGWEWWEVRWSPDGKHIAALGYPTEGKKINAVLKFNAVFVVPASGGELRQLTPDVEYKEGLRWHPDGQRLAYHVSRWDSETRQAYLDGRPPDLLFDAPGDIWDYVGNWSPDGRRFFFFGSVKKDWALYAYDEASGDITLVSPRSSVPNFSRDGKTMAWYSIRNTVRQTWVMENFLPEPAAAE